MEDSYLCKTSTVNMLKLLSSVTQKRQKNKANVCFITVFNNKIKTYSHIFAQENIRISFLKFLYFIIFEYDFPPFFEMST